MEPRIDHYEDEPRKTNYQKQHRSRTVLPHLVEIPEDFLKIHSWGIYTPWPKMKMAPETKSLLFLQQRCAQFVPSCPRLPFAGAMR